MKDFPRPSLTMQKPFAVCTKNKGRGLNPGLCFTCCAAGACGRRRLKQVAHVCHVAGASWAMAHFSPRLLCPEGRRSLQVKAWKLANAIPLILCAWLLDECGGIAKTMAQNSVCVVALVLGHGAVVFGHATTLRNVTCLPLGRCNICQAV